MKHLFLFLFMFVIGCDVAPADYETLRAAEFAKPLISRELKADPLKVDKRTADFCDSNNDGVYTYTFTITNVSAQTVSGAVFSVGNTGTDELLTPSQTALPSLAPNQSVNVTVRLDSTLPTSRKKVAWLLVVGNSYTIEKQEFFYNC